MADDTRASLRQRGTAITCRPAYAYGRWSATSTTEVYWKPAQAVYRQALAAGNSEKQAQGWRKRNWTKSGKCAIPSEWQDITLIDLDRKLTERVAPDKAMFNIYFKLAAEPPPEWQRFFEHERRYLMHTLWRTATLKGKYIVLESPWMRSISTMPIWRTMWPRATRVIGNIWSTVRTEQARRRRRRTIRAWWRISGGSWLWGKR